MFGKTLVTGGAGFLGRRLISRLTNLCDSIYIPRSCVFDLRYQTDVLDLFAQKGPFDTVFHLAATVSGIGHISKYPATYFFDNAQMGINIIQASHIFRVQRLIVAGSVCAYPQNTTIPMDESQLWEGKPEPSNASYGIAKRLLLTMLEAYNEQFGLRSSYILLANLYGPGDDFTPTTSHVIPALIRKMHEDPARLNVWGTGNASRDFLFVDDAASALIELARVCNRPLPVNIGSGREITIRDLVSLLCDLLPYHGFVSYDTNRPDGQPRRQLSLERAKHLIPNWSPTTDFALGLTKTIDYFQENHAHLRVD